MKVLLINGSPNQHGCTDTALSEVEGQLHKEGIETERYWVGRQPVPGCLGCGHCVETGKCVFRDGVNELAARVDEFDALVVGSPVYYAGPSGQVHCFLDRLFYVTGGTWAETYDVLISTIKSCTDTDARYAMMHLAEDMLMESGCITPIYFYTDIYMLSDSVQGFYSNPLGYKYFMYCTVEG